ncbi:PorT family protein [Fulvivirga maritima]|uniref:outer membrane beta-barrel protein n=1 Tax=Fulvivirga maritima TaxID=2904247 RepID=UPI001F3189A3|nr:outer membrane beta-barrel protein [Fulvivirga maritima]UII25849.1 PorT family protein [Fulvivirga maritima]
MKRFFTVLLFLFFFKSAHAQVKFGVQAGFNVSKIAFHNYDTYTDQKQRLSPKLGIYADFEISQSFLIRPGVFYSGKGTEYDFGGSDNDVAISEYAEIPVNAVLKLHKVEIFAGLYGAVLLKKRFKPGAEGMDRLYVDGMYLPRYVPEDKGLRRADFGFQMGVGYNFQPMRVSAGFSRGFYNLFQKASNYDGSKSTAFNKVFNVSIAYSLAK